MERGTALKRFAKSVNYTSSALCLIVDFRTDRNEQMVNTQVGLEFAVFIKLVIK